jgi:hypothetical protein
LGIESPSVEESSQEISFSDLLIERTVQQELISDLLSLNQPFRWFAIVGESGTGKSSLLWLLSKNINLTLAIRGHDLIATRLKDRLCDDEQNSKKLSAFDENKKCIIKIIEEQIRKTDKVIYFFIDTLDLVINKIGESSLRYFLQDILDISQQLILVTTCRPREFKFLTKRFNEFNKAKESEKNPEKKHDYCSYEVKSFDNKELALVLKRYTSVYHENWSQQEQQDLVDRLKQLKNENREISQICRHPLSLRLLFEVYENRVPEDLNLSVLYKLFWEKKVRGEKAEDEKIKKTKIRKARECYVAQAGLYMFELGQEAVNVDPVEGFFIKKYKSQDPVEIRGLLRSENIFRHKDDQTDDIQWLGASMTVREQLEFFHQSFLEYSAAWALRNLGEQIILRLLEHVKAVQSDFMRLEVLRQIVFQDDSLARLIIPKLKNSSSIFLQETALYIYIKLNKSQASFFRYEIETILLSSINGSIKNTNNRLLLHFLENVHNISEQRYYELFNLTDGLFRRILITSHFSIIDRLFQAVAKITIFRGDYVAEWLTWATFSWKPNISEELFHKQPLYPSCLVTPLLNMVRWNEACSITAIWKIFSELANEKTKQYILEQWPCISNELNTYYGNKLLSFLENFSKIKDQNKKFSKSYAICLNKLFNQEVAYLIQQLKSLASPQNIIATRILVRIIPVSERTRWIQEIFSENVSNKKYFFMKYFLAFWLEEDSNVKEMLCKFFIKETDLKLFSKIIEILAKYEGKLPLDKKIMFEWVDNDKFDDLDKVQKKYFLMLMAKTLSDVNEHDFEIFFSLVEKHVPPKDRFQAFGNIPSKLTSPLQHILIKKIRYFADKTDGYTKQTAIKLLTGQSWIPSIVKSHIDELIQILINSRDKKVINEFMEALLNKSSSLINVIPISCLRQLSIDSFKKDDLRRLGIKVFSYLVIYYEDDISYEIWPLIWEQIKKEQNPTRSTELWILIQNALKNKRTKVLETWREDIITHSFDKWMMNDQMQKPFFEAVIAVGEWGVIDPEPAVDLLLRYINSAMKKDGRYKIIGALVRIFKHKNINQKHINILSNLIDKLINGTESENGQIILVDVFLRIEEATLAQIPNWVNFEKLAAMEEICDRAKQIIRDHKGRSLPTPQLSEDIIPKKSRKKIC